MTSGKKLDDLTPATKFHNEEAMTEAIQTWMKSDAGREAVKDILKMSNEGAKKVKPGYVFPSVEIFQNIGQGYQATSGGSIQSIQSLTKVKVVLHPDGVGGFILKSAFPTL